MCRLLRQLFLEIPLFGSPAVSPSWDLRLSSTFVVGASQLQKTTLGFDQSQSVTIAAQLGLVAEPVERARPITALDPTNGYESPRPYDRLLTPRAVRSRIGLGQSFSINDVSMIFSLGPARFSRPNKEPRLLLMSPINTARRNFLNAAGVCIVFPERSQRKFSPMRLADSLRTRTGPISINCSRN